MGNGRGRRRARKEEEGLSKLAPHVCQTLGEVLASSYITPFSQGRKPTCPQLLGT